MTRQLIGGGGGEEGHWLRKHNNLGGTGVVFARAPGLRKYKGGGGGGDSHQFYFPDIIYIIE